MPRHESPEHDHTTTMAINIESQLIEGVLRPRSDVDGARDVALAAQGMAAFTFIYGIDVR